MVVASCCWVSRAHGVKDVCGCFSVSMRRRRKGLCWGGDFWRFGGEWWLFGGVSDVVHRSFWLEKEDRLREVDQWGRFGCFLLASGCEVVYGFFSVGVGWFQVGFVAGRKVGDGGFENRKIGVV
ncbi:hypothetical protein R3W88_021235 [Solanum pinnatisectum]|uniref:Transmembrane protein n=1 Tax=Solanum pinnatisectum TaxID=50273 RepID=A0AAV9LV71_9SOLN|nr:hypothetical protein R3W88_021235 [Solanum pinnatisectum]